MFHLHSSTKVSLVNSNFFTYEPNTNWITLDVSMYLAMNRSLIKDTFDYIRGGSRYLEKGFQLSIKGFLNNMFPFKSIDLHWHILPGSATVHTYISFLILMAAIIIDNLQFNYVLFTLSKMGWTQLNNTYEFLSEYNILL